MWSSIVDSAPANVAVTVARPPTGRIAMSETPDRELASPVSMTMAAVPMVADVKREGRDCARARARCDPSDETRVQPLGQQRGAGRTAQLREAGETCRVVTR